MLQFLQEARLQMLRLDQAQQRALGIGVGDDGPGVDLVAVGENDAGRSSILHLDADHLAGGTNLGAGFCRRCSHGRGERARTSHNVGCRPGRISIGSAAQQQSRSWNPPTTVRGTCRRFPARRWCRAAIPSRTTRRPDRRPPSAPSAAGDRDPSRPGRESCGRPSAAPTDCRMPDRRDRAASWSSAGRRPRRCAPATSEIQP